MSIHLVVRSVMRICIVILSLVLLTRSFALAQNEPVDFGVVSKADLAMKSHPLDTTATAIVLFDVGEVKLDDGSLEATRYERRLRVKILKQEAVNTWGSFTFRSQKGEFAKLKGATYRLENNQIVIDEVPKSTILRRAFTKEIEEVTVAFPNVQVGAVIELSYVQKSRLFQIPQWQFQREVPTLWSEFSVWLPTENLDYRLRGQHALTKHEHKYEGKFQRWVLTDIPAFKPEPLMPDPDFYRSSIRFLTKRDSWLGLYQRYWNSPFGGQRLKADRKTKELTLNITRGVSDSVEQIKAVSNYLKKEITWNGIRDNFADPPEEILDKKRGTVADINLLMGAMLKSLGFNVSVVLLSTRKNGYITDDYPCMDQFNYAVCHVILNGKDLLLDATDSHLPYDYLPKECYNHKGFFMSAKEYGWIGVEPTKRDKLNVTADISLDNDGRVAGKANFLMSEYQAVQSRKLLAKSGRKELTRGFIDETRWAATSLSEPDTSRVGEAMQIDYSLESDAYGSGNGGMIYLNPFPFLKEEKNPFLSDRRTYPIDFDGITEMTLVCTINIPANYTVEELPQSKAYALPGNSAKCFINFGQSGSQILVTSRLMINKTLFEPEEYEALREFYTRIISKKNEDIVLKQK